jgi:hypothetical protein
MSEKIKLTRQQNAVIWCLQNGWVLITSNEIPGATVANDKHEYRIGSRLFWNLHAMGLIYQRGWEHNFDYHLTPLGEEIKTKPV